jgi:adenylylsulfate kinase
VHVATPLAACQARDPKGLYARARQDAQLGLTGVQADYEIPLAPALRLDTQHRAVADCLPALLGLLPTPFSESVP